MKDNKTKFNQPWIPFYQEMADKLLAFKDNRSELVKVINAVYDQTGIAVPKLEDGELFDIDPFTVFGLFNKHITSKNRMAIMNAFKELLHMNSAVSGYWDGVPVMNNLNAAFYGYGRDRPEKDIDHLWEVFEAALSLADHPSQDSENRFIKAYDQAMSQKRVKWNLTIGLYWIRPYKYLALDANNRDFLQNEKYWSESLISGLEPVVTANTPPDGRNYLYLLKRVEEDMHSMHPSWTIPILSASAFEANTEAQSPETDSDSRKTKNLNSAFMRWMGPLITALRQLGGSATPKQAEAQVAKNEKLTEEELKAVRGKNKINKFSHELAFARHRLAYAGYIDGSVRGVWTLTEAGKTVEMTPELASEIVRKFNNKDQSSSVTVEEEKSEVKYWLYSPGQGASKWNECLDQGQMVIGWGEIGDLNEYEYRDEIQDALAHTFNEASSYSNSSLALWQFYQIMKPGDIIFAKQGKNTILGRGVVQSDYFFDEQVPDTYKNFRRVEWKETGNFPVDKDLGVKTLTDISEYTGQIKMITEAIASGTEEETEDETPLKLALTSYTPEDFLEDVYISENAYNNITAALRKKKNIILTGPPGVGKTYMSQRLAYSMMGEKDMSRVMMVQFHQSYSYEDFIMGFRPTESGFEQKSGPFYDFCKKAQDDPDRNYFFIIDEINRGNLSKILGELFMLLEADKRGMNVRLLYSDELFSIPPNVYIIGMMNTADRSLALLDYALRRRFAFIELKPEFDSDGFVSYQESLNSSAFDRLIDTVKQLNNVIAKDDFLGKGFLIGHSFFCGLDPDNVTSQDLESIVDFELKPLIHEYWFDEPTKANDWSQRLKNAIKEDGNAE